MQILVGYATSEGQTRKIARFAADHLTAQGHSVELLALEDTKGLGLDRFDAVVLAGSIHASGFQRSLRDFATANAGALNARSGLFLTVSLSAAGEDPNDWAGLRKATDDFVSDTGWTPDRIEHLAGAFRFTEYSLFVRFVMRRIAAEKDPGVDATTDTEYTDWEKLAGLLDDWAGSGETGAATEGRGT